MAESTTETPVIGHASISSRLFRRCTVVELQRAQTTLRRPSETEVVELTTDVTR
jgi:hypothetical protein